VGTAAQTSIHQRGFFKHSLALHPVTQTGTTFAMKLYNYWRSSCSYRVRLALHAKNLPFEYVPVALNSGAQHQPLHRQRNPIGTVPVLEISGAPEPTHIAQSIAIFEYLEEAFPAHPLLPKDSLQRAQVRALAETVNSGIQPFHNLTTLNFVRDVVKFDEKKFAEFFINTGLVGLEKMASATAGEFLFGDLFGWADCCLLPQLFGARRMGVDTQAYPLLSKIEARCLQLDFVQKAKPEAQIDAQ
jgi:maleylpyruvate isomerase